MSLDDLKNKFRDNLTGTWITYQGSADIMQNEEYRFHADGTGRETHNSVLTGKEEREFRWRQLGPYRIEIYFPEPGEPDDWVTINYDFINGQADTGLQPALVQVDESGKPFKGFYMSIAPLINVRVAASFY